MRKINLRRQGAFILAFVMLFSIAIMPTATAEEGYTAEETTFETLSTVGFQEISAGMHYTTGIRADGSLWAWGHNRWGQLGDGTTVDRHSPVQIQPGTRWQSVSAGAAHTLGIRTDGSLWAWGSNCGGVRGGGGGALGDGTADGRHSPVEIQPGTRWQSVSAGDIHSAGIRTDGSLWAWGDNRWGQLGDGTTVNRHSPVEIQPGTRWQSVSAGRGGQMLGIRTDGSLWAWGHNGTGTLGDGTRVDRHSPVEIQPGTRWQSLSAGSLHSAGIRTDGSLWVWGNNQRGQLGDGTTVNRHSPVAIQPDTRWQSVSAGHAYTLGIRTDGSLWAWGDNWSDTLGDGTRVDTHLQPGTRWQSVSVGGFHSAGIRTDGSLWTWGGNMLGELGLGFAQGGAHPPRQVLIPDQGNNGDERPLPFTDVSSTNWFYPYVRYVLDNSIMQGTTETTFAPSRNFSRAMAVATLYRIVHGGTAVEVPYARNRQIFTDVNVGAWHSPYVAWAYDNNIVSGVGNNRFAPNANITREQFATIMFRFADFMDYDTEVKQGSQWNSFTDRDRISTWAGAREALQWANYHGLITGRTSTTIVPRGTATRAEASAILTRFIETFGD